METRSAEQRGEARGRLTAALSTGKASIDDFDCRRPATPRKATDLVADTSATSHGTVARVSRPRSSAERRAGDSLQRCRPARLDHQL
eukprot:scaffold1402_cov254-Pinguiococcus_pyrenoidosus.AAC.1